MEVETPSNVDDEINLISTLKSNLNNGPCSTGSTTSRRNNEVLSIKESIKIKRMKELKFKKKCIELGLEQNDGLSAVSTCLEYVKNASSDISDVESVDGNISKLSSSTSGSCSSSSSSNNSEDEGSSIESEKNDSVAIKRSESILPHLRLDLKPEKSSLLDHKLENQNKNCQSQIILQNEEDSLSEKEGVVHFHKNNIMKDYYNTYLNSPTQNSSLLKKNKNLKRKLDDDGNLDPEVNADQAKKLFPKCSNGKSPKLELEKKMAKNLSSEKVISQDAPIPSVTLKKAHLANDIEHSTHSEVNLLHLDMNKPEYRKSKLKPKLKAKNYAVQSDNLIDQVAEAFAKQLSALNLGQLTPFQASQLNMVLEKQNESSKQLNLSSSFNKFTTGFDQLMEPTNPPLVSSPMSSPSSETPNRLSIDADDTLPIVAEVVMSDGSENGLDLNEEIPDEESQVNEEVEKYVQSFIDCSNRGSVVEYPPMNNEVPTDGTDLTAWQLEKVSLPPFTPFVSPPSWLRFTIPAEGYKCSSCGDIFFIESSLVQHKERRSVWISLECGPCDAKLTFYNKCSFKEHIQYHSAKGEHVDEDTVAVRTLPLQLTKLLQPIMVPVPQSLRPMRALNKSSPMKHVKKILNSPGSLGKENQPRKEIADERSKTADDGNGVDHGNLASPAKRNVRCYLCERMFFSVRELMSHMRTNQSSSDQRVECRKCLLVLPSVCAAKAHILTHPPANSSNISVCPECGSRCDGPRDFVHHLNTCGHQYRRSGVLCTQCQVCFFKFGEDFINHWIKEHCSKSYECVVCSNTFESLVFHKCSSPGQRVLATFKCLLTCPLCPYVVQLHTQEEKETQDKIRAHLADSHASVINRIHYVYKSKFCTNAFRSKDELRAHHDREHRRDNHYRTKTCTLHHEVLGYQHQYFNGQEPRNAFITMSVALSPEEMEEAQTRDVPTVSSVIDKTLFPDAPMTLETIKGLKAEKEKTSKQALEAKEDHHTKDPPAKKDSEFVESLRPHVCYRCGYTYTGSKDFRRHKRSCEGESAVRLCQVCGVSAVGEEFSKHCLTHVREGVVMCMYCNGAPFSTEQMLNQHFELHVHEQFSYPVVCAFCSFSMSDVGVALLHLHKEHDPNSVLSPSLDSLDVECERCGRKFHGERGLNVHLTRCTVGTATPMPTPASGRQCHVCKKALTSEMFGKHIISHLEEGLLVCSLCDGLALPSSMALLHHLEEHASTLQYPSVCPMCSFNMTSTSYALAHLKEDHGFGNLSCDDCEMHYTFTYQLQRHIDIVHRVCLYAKRRYICWICRAYDHVKKETLMNHFRMVHGLSMEEVDEKVMIRTRGQGTMPTSHFIPTKPLGSKELGGVSKGDSKSEGDSPKFKGKTSDPHPNKSKALEETTSSRMTSEDMIKSSFDEAQMEINLENIVIKKELLDVIGKVSDGETYSSPNAPLNAEVSTTFKKSPLSDIKIKSEGDVKQSASEVVDSKPKTAYRRHKKIRRKLFTCKRDRKLRESTKVLIKRLPESTLLIRPGVTKKAEPEPKAELATKQGSGPNENAKKKKKKQFRCNLCSYSSNSNEKLKGHQAKHEEGSVADGFVCSECGQSFVVEPSLKRHLFFAHKIKQKPQTASKAADTVFEVRKTSRKRKPTPKLAATVAAPPNPRRITIKIKNSPKLEKEIKTSDDKESELQCCVCKEEFDSSVKLYSHLRTHGMAFLKMGRKKRGFIQQERASIKC